jgi:Domain of Unknown Function (DUF1080)
LTHQQFIFFEEHMPKFFLYLLASVVGFVSSANPTTVYAQNATPAAAQVPPVADEKQGEWIALFNGKDLSGWTPKIRGFELGDNFGNTFRVQDGLLQVRYDAYDKYNERFGHLFFEKEYSSYDLRIEYRFVGEQVAGGPGWAWRNSGVMIHGQPAKTLTKDQDFPCSIEVQFLGGDGKNARPTANLCSPGTHVEMNSKLFTQHCTNSKSATYHGDDWVTVDVVVRGNRVIQHKIDGKVVLEYNRPQLDPQDGNAKLLIKDNPDYNLQLSGGTISLQSESHPIDFRKVELRVREESDE